MTLANPLNVTAEQAVETFEAAKEELLLNPRRQGQMVTLPDHGEVLMTGDLHDHRTNWRKLQHIADLGSHPDRHLILHELIHGDHYDERGREDSWITLYRAAELLLDFPDQVHFLLANHDLAQIHGEGISKAGMSVCEAFTEAVKRDFGDRYGSVEMSMTEFLLSFPLAVRAPAAGLFFCHSLPSDEEIDEFDYDVFGRDSLNGEDYRRRTGPVYQLIWGRNMSPEKASDFANAVGANIIITGHQPQDRGFLRNGDRHLILASDHNRGVYAILPLDQKLSIDEVEGRIRQFLAINDRGGD